MLKLLFLPEKYLFMRLKMKKKVFLFACFNNYVYICTEIVSPRERLNRNRRIYFILIV